MFDLNHMLSQQQRTLHKGHFEDSRSIGVLTEALASYMREMRNGRKMVVACIGTDRSTGDCLGPLVGSKLREKRIPGLVIYGTLDDPVHASNLHASINEINNLYPDSFVLAIDACLGKLDNVGNITLAKGSLKPGAGVHKNLPLVGNVYMTGVVNVGGFMEYLVLQNTRLALVMKMADKISEAVFNAYKQS